MVEAPGITTVPVIEIDAVLARASARVVDLRSPAEFAGDHLPGAVNVPLFDNAERALIGLLYHRRSPEAAFARGGDLVRAKVVDLVGRIAEAAGEAGPQEGARERAEELLAEGLAGLDGRLVPERLEEPPRAPLVLHCWRGGLRSRSVVALLRGLGWRDAVALEGGYKAYRARVRAELEAWRAPSTFVLRGLTGVGKTLVLRELERLRPGWTLDLEGAAGHRSSLLGMVGLEPVGQKAFESRLAARLRAGFSGPLVIEGESRRVGDVVVPARIWEALSGGVNLLLETGVERRIDVLVADYLARPSARPRLREQLAAVQARMELGARADLVGLLDAGRERELVRLLLDRYYDPLYRRSERGKAYATRIDSTDPRAAAEAIADWVGARLAAR